MQSVGDEAKEVTSYRASGDGSGGWGMGGFNKNKIDDSDLESDGKAKD